MQLSAKRENLDVHLVALVTCLLGSRLILFLLESRCDTRRSRSPDTSRPLCRCRSSVISPQEWKTLSTAKALKLFAPQFEFGRTKRLQALVWPRLVVYLAQTGRAGTGSERLSPMMPLLLLRWPILRNARSRELKWSSWDGCTGASTSFPALWRSTTMLEVR